MLARLRSARRDLHAIRNVGDHLSDGITSFAGSWPFVILHSVWFILWIVLRVEAFPFGLLTMLVSLEAIYLSTLVLMSQNRQAAKDRARDSIDSQEIEMTYRIDQEQLEILRGLQAHFPPSETEKERS